MVNQAFANDPVPLEKNINEGNDAVGRDDSLDENDEVAVKEQDKTPTDSVPRDDTYGNQESKFLNKKN